MIRQLQPRGIAFDLRRSVIYAPSPMGSALLGYFTRHRLGPLTCVYEGDDGETNGMVQVWPTSARAQWDLAFIAPSLDHYRDAPDLWQKLLSHLIILGAQDNIERVYARAREDAETEEVLRSSGFTAVSREEVFVLAQPGAPSPQPKGLRRLDRGDHDALNALYHQVVPPLVQKAEGAAPHWQCDCNGHTLLRRHPPAREFIWVDRRKIIAYLGLCQSSKGYWLEIVVRPEYRAELLPHIKYILTLTEPTNTRALYVPVPDYSVGLGWLLRTLGFESFVRQALFVAYTVARAPVRRPLMIPGLDRSVDVRTPVAHVVAPFDESDQHDGGQQPSGSMPAT